MNNDDHKYYLEIVAFLLFLLLLLLALFVMVSDVDASSDCSQFNLDGDPSKWERVERSPMYEAGKPTHDHVADFYRETCGSYDNVAVILLPGYSLDPNAAQDEHWVRIGSKTGEKILQMGDPTFELLVGAEGWEGKFPAVPDILVAKTQYGDDQTARGCISPTAVELEALEVSRDSPLIWTTLIVAFVISIILLTLLTFLWMRK